MEPDPGLAERILKLVRAENYQPVKPKVLAKKLNLQSDDDKRTLKRTIKQLVKQGQLEYGAKHLVKPSAHRTRPTIVGMFRRIKRGGGFVIPRAVPGQDKSPDIFIPPHKSKDAASGDIVSVQLSRRPPSEPGRLRGAIDQIVERDTHRFVGTYEDPDGYPKVVVDGDVFAHPVPVGDPGAKGAQSGDKVVIELIRFPSHRHAGEGVIVEVLGPKGTPGVDTLTILREYDLPESFPDEVLEYARQQAAQFNEEIPEGRRDLTGIPIITIDPVDARDFDDAISLNLLDNGHWRLGVHIADVAHFVPADSILDVEARQRGTSVYLPDRVIPMLPETVSNHVASLQPDRLRFARTVEIELTDSGALVATDVYRSAIRSCRRFAYEEVDQFLADREAWREQLTPEVHLLLGRMHELAMLLRRRRLEGGAIELNLPEVKIDLNDQGEVDGAHLVEHTESHQVIEEFMLLANQAVAQALTDRGIVFLHRVHEAPDPRKLQALTRFVRELGYECESLESRFEIKRVVEQARGAPEETSLNFAVLKSMQKAVYSPEGLGHYALHATHYCHFTSPIRRYPDLTVHRLFDLLDAGKTPPAEMAAWHNLADHCSDREQRAEQAERDLVKLKLLNFLSSRIGMKLPAVITGVEDYGLFAQGTELPAEGLIHVTSLQDDHYQFDRETHALVGFRAGNQYRLGDQVEVEVAHVDVDRRHLDLRIVRHLVRDRPGRSRGADAPRTQGTRKNATASRKRGRQSPGKGPSTGRKRRKRKS